ncbi:MAG: response regulator [Candidatus Abyssobacteria bacterium SURF_5]|uniref:Response regulator n=1 Tax=Abyssobacteria bacterium (strain SURF_5) TaxID=2093360 RepID=A0A3A4N6Y6_ABYX5|nr:MAG: response regulator [Candidatus Abyssubacteria bacterium SURF_5]
MDKKNIRVLVVDDEERFRKTATATLKKRGFEVEAVGSGLEAINNLKTNDFDVVVLDVKMPGMDGNEALREIKILKPDLEVVMLTAHGTVDSALAGWRDQVFAYLTKPIDVDILAEKIRDAAAKRRGIDSALWYTVWKDRVDITD